MLKRYDHMACLPSLLIMHSSFVSLIGQLFCKCHFGDVNVKECVKSNVGREPEIEQINRIE